MRQSSLRTYKNFALYSQNFIKNKRTYTKAIENLIVAEANNPIKEPKEALSALFVSLLSKRSSPMNAPKKAPIKIPKGIGDNKPISRPIVVP